MKTIEELKRERLEEFDKTFQYEYYSGHLKDLWGFVEQTIYLMDKRQRTAPENQIDEFDRWMRMDNDVAVVHKDQWGELITFLRTNTLLRNNHIKKLQGRQYVSTEVITQRSIRKYGGETEIGT